MTSLRARLGAGLFLSLLVMVSLLWITVGLSVRLMLEQQLASRLSHDGESLLAGVQFDSAGRLQLDAARIQGIYQRPFSGHYFLISSAAQEIQSRSLWDIALPVPAVAVGESSVNFVDGPQQQPLLLWTRGFRKQGRELRVAVAEDLQPLQAGVRRFQWQLAAWSLAVVCILLLLQQYLVARALRTLTAAAAAIEHLERGAISVLDERVPDEVQPLVQALNRLLLRQRQRLQRSREALGNLAHTMKTPLTLLQQLAAEKVPASDREAHAKLERYGRQINDTVNTTLRRAQLAGNSLGAARFDLQQDLPELVEALNRLHRHRELGFEAVTGAVRQLPLEQQDGMELLGNLLDNAWKWARSTVRLAVLDEPDTLTISVEDDGPGVNEQELQLLSRRGIRRDEDAPGHGIGLSIVKSLIEELGGSIEFTTSAALGGLRVCIRLDRDAGEI
jgi:signal transduction histidine kinase